MTRRLGSLLLALVVPAGILLAFGLWSARASSFFFPPLTEIVRVFAATWVFDRVGSDVVPSLLRLLAGYGVAVVAGVALGTALGLSRIARTAFDPVIEFLRALPAPAVIPFALLAFGTGDDAKVFIIVLGTIWPILLNTVDGVRGVEEQQLDMARSYQIPLAARLRHIVLPAAGPRIFAGTRTSLSIGIVLMVVSEMVASRNGIGYFTLQSQRSFAIPEMWSGILLLGLLGFVLNWAFLRVERRVLFWHRGAKGLPGDAGPSAPAALSAPPCPRPPPCPRLPAPPRPPRPPRRSPVLEVSHLRKTYGSGEGARPAVADLSFELSDREFLCVLGSSGCGKTTMLRCLGGLEPPTSGRITLRGEEVAGPPEDVALVFQDYGRSLLPWMTVERNVSFPLRYKGVPSAESRSVTGEALEAVGLAGRERSDPWQLSGGMQQRVAIARALAYQPRILLMDEPLASVDAQTRSGLEDLLLDVWQRFAITVLFVTHDIDEAVYLADRVLVLDFPASARLSLAVGLPRPRDQLETKQLPEFAHLRSELLAALVGGAGPAVTVTSSRSDRGSTTTS